MGWISSVFVHKAINEVKAPLGVQRSLFQVAGVDPEAPVDPKTMVADEDFFRLLERLADDFQQGRSIPILMGAAMRCDDYGAFGLAFKSAPDLLGSYARVERYGKVVTSIANFRVVPSEGSVLMEVIPGRETRLGLTMTNELALAAATALSREVSIGTVKAKAVHLTSEKPQRDDAHRAHFRCPILYGSAQDALELDHRTARQHNKLADTGLSRFFEAYLDRELGEIKDVDGLAHRVLEQIGNALSDGVPTVSKVAQNLGMSGRTLQRRLAEADLAYQDLVADARKTLSAKLLLGTDYALAEIAFLTGFSDQSTFTRAFKRWYGQTPASYRRQD